MSNTDIVFTPAARRAQAERGSAGAYEKKAAAGFPNVFGATPDNDAAGADRRFSAEAWKSDPRFDLVRRTYLAYSDWLQGAVESRIRSAGIQSRIRSAGSNLRYRGQRFDSLSDVPHIFAQVPHQPLIFPETVAGAHSLRAGL